MPLLCPPLSYIFDDVDYMYLHIAFRQSTWRPLRYTTLLTMLPIRTCMLAAGRAPVTLGHQHDGHAED